MENITDEILKHLKEEDLSDDMKFLCEMTSLETVRNLIKTVNGNRIYIPRITAYRKAIELFFQANRGIIFDNIAIKKMATQIGVSENYLLDIARRKSQCVNQADLFEEDLNN